MRLYGCDRCGETIALTGRQNRRPENWSSVNTDTGANQKPNHRLLCPRCTKLLEEFMSEP